MPSVWMHLIQLLSKHRRSESERYNPHLFHRRAEKRPQGWGREEGGHCYATNYFPTFLFTSSSHHSQLNPFTLRWSALSWMLLPSSVNDLNLLPSGEKRTAGQRWREEWLIIEKWEPRACRAPNLFYVILRGNLHPVALALGMMNEPEFVLDYT